jgi:hypothetical protein
MYFHLNICRSPISVTGLGLRHDPHQLEGCVVITVWCSNCRDTVIMDTLWRCYVGKQESEEQWPGCRMGHRKQENAQWPGTLYNMLCLENFECIIAH